MSDDQQFRPRRAMPPEGDQVDPAPADDTPAGSPTAVSSPAPVVPPEHAAFMRPGTVPEHVLGALDESSEEVRQVVTPALSDQATAPLAVDTPLVDAVPGEFVQQGGEPSGSPSEWGPARTSGASAGDQSAVSPEDDVDALSAGRPGPRPVISTPMKVGAAVLVPLVMAGAFLGVRAATQRDDVIVQQTATASSSTPTPTPTPALTTAALVRPADAAAALGNSGWSEAQTWETVEVSDPGITCMSTLPGQPAPVLTRQRGLTSTTESKAAVLQRMDAFGSDALAHEAYTQRLAALSACDDVPALIVSASQVQGVADESFAMTIAFEDAQTVHHTVLLTRTGRSVTMTDVANTGPAIGADKVAALAKGPLSRLCTTSEGTCPTTPSTKAVAVPPTPVRGWLAQSDLPRVTKGQGMWSPTEPANVTSKGTQCENLTLATVAGPTARQQRSYILTQDDAAPEGFGIDQVLFTFANDQAAQVFGDKLVRNLNSCGSRTETATVSGARNLSITGAGGTRVTGRIWQVEQAVSESEKVRYRVAVVRAGERVTYLVTNPTASFDFTDQAWLLVAARAGQRATQAD